MILNTLLDKVNPGTLSPIDKLGKFEAEPVI